MKISVLHFSFFNPLEMSGLLQEQMFGLHKLRKARFDTMNECCLDKGFRGVCCVTDQWRQETASRLRFVSHQAAKTITKSERCQSLI